MEIQLEIDCKDGTEREDRDAIVEAVWCAIQKAPVDVGTKLVIEVLPNGPGSMIVKVWGNTK